MKQLFLFLFCFIINYCLAQHATITVDRENIMYVGIPNSITVIAEGLNCKNTNVAIEGGQIIAGEGPCNFVVNVKEPGKVIAKVYAKTRQGVKLVGTREFRVHLIPNPVARIGGIRNDTIRRNILAAQLGVIASFENFDFDARAVVTNYTIIMCKDKKTVFSKTIAKTAKFDDEIINQLQTLKNGDLVFICDIVAKGPDGRDRKLDPIYLKVID